MTSETLRVTIFGRMTRVNPRDGSVERGHRVRLSRLWDVLDFMSRTSDRRASGSGVGAGVLIRAIEPTFGVAIMERESRRPADAQTMAQRPGRLSEALAIDRRLDGIAPLPAGPLWLRS